MMSGLQVCKMAGFFQTQKQSYCNKQKGGNDAGEIFFTRFPDFCEISLKYRTFLFDGSFGVFLSFRSYEISV